VSRALWAAVAALTLAVIGLTAWLTPASGLITRLLLVALSLVAIGFVWRWSRLQRQIGAAPRWADLALGFVANFFDTLGIGSFAPTTAVLKFTRRIPDEQIPGTLNVGHALPTLTEALIFIAAVLVEPRLLVTMIAASTLGAWLGAGVVSRLPRRAVQVGMSAALAAAAALFIAANLHWMPLGAAATGLGGWRWALAVGGNFLLGALMSLGIGLYAPCLILLSLLGLSPRAAFPIMMGSCAFLMPIGGMRFVRTGRYSAPVAIGFALGGPPAGLLAAYAVKSMPLQWLRWLVAGVVLYAAALMLHAACRGARA
jgi:uncharacterized membrane protein YfcA